MNKVIKFLAEGYSDDEKNNASNIGTHNKSKRDCRLDWWFGLFLSHIYAKPN